MCMRSARALLGIVVFMVVACGDDDAEPVDSGPTADSEPPMMDTGEPSTPIEVGLMMAQTGELGFAFVGESGACSAAFAQINEGGGPMGRMLELTENHDTGSGDETIIAASVSELLTANVPAILGATSSGEAIAAIPELTGANMLFLSGAAGAPSVDDTDDNDLFFRTIPVATYSIGGTAGFLRLEGHNTLVVLAKDDTANAELGQGIADAFSAAGGTASVVNYTFEEGMAFDAAGVLAQATMNNPDAIVLSGFPMDAAAILNAWDPAAWTGQWMLGASLSGQAELLDLVGAEKMEGIAGIGHASPVGPRFDEFQRRFTAHNGEGLDSFAAFQAAWYDAAILLGLAMHQAGSLEGPAIRDALREVANSPGEEVSVLNAHEALAMIDAGMDINYVGITGDIEFDSTGNSPGRAGLSFYRDGALVQDRILVEGVDY